MKEGIFPRWEDHNNINGGSWSYIIPKLKSNESWLYISIIAISENLVNYEYKDEINGISLIPRTNVSVIKIWNKYYKNYTKINLKINNKYFDNSNTRYKKHK